MNENWDAETAELLAEAIDDWIDLGWLANVVRGEGERQSDDLMERGIRFATHVIASGLVVPGDLGDEEGFQPWPLAPAEAADRIAAEWRRLGEPVPRPGDIAWLECTPKGEEYARHLPSHPGD